MIRKPEKKILVSFSGGETSAYMINYLLLKYPTHKYKFVFMNTGEENEETLIFVNKCQEYFNIDVVWLEFDVKYNKPSFKIVDFNSAYRSHLKGEKESGYLNHPFHKLIKKYGIPSIKAPFCSSRLKGDVLWRYMSSIGMRKRKEYTLAIGIRSDEMDRCGNYWYPLVIADVTKPIVNTFWSKMPFRLQLKGYEGNCKTCWKKSFRKLATIYKENPRHYDFFKEMENKFTNIPITRKDHKTGLYKTINPPFKFFRDLNLTDDIAKMSKENFETPLDDSRNNNYQHSILHDGTELDSTNGCIESCDVF
tara:strand:- start:49 stop:969 length:921 start_codon:yes stop_codon:yes gene_type:complete